MGWGRRGAGRGLWFRRGGRGALRWGFWGSGGGGGRRLRPAACLRRPSPAEAFRDTAVTWLPTSGHDVWPFLHPTYMPDSVTPPAPGASLPCHGPRTTAFLHLYTRRHTNLFHSRGG